MFVSWLHADISLVTKPQSIFRSMIEAKRSYYAVGVVKNTMPLGSPSRHINHVTGVWANYAYYIRNIRLVYDCNDCNHGYFFCVRIQLHLLFIDLKPNILSHSYQEYSLEDSEENLSLSTHITIPAVESDLRSDCELVWSPPQLTTPYTLVP